MGRTGEEMGQGKRKVWLGQFQQRKRNNPDPVFKVLIFFYFLDLNLDSNLFQIQKNSK
jgi:hypothetical protein